MRLPRQAEYRKCGRCHRRLVPGAMQRAFALLRRTGTAPTTVFVTAPALQRTTPLKKRRAALRPGHGYTGLSLRCRSDPSCATEATKVPSGLKIMPRVSPRPARAEGESWA